MVAQTTLAICERRDDALSDEAIQACLSIVKIALYRRNEEEAVATIRRAFTAEPPAAITEESSLHDLGLPLRIANALEARNIFTVGELLLFGKTALSEMTGLGPKSMTVLSID